MRNVAAVLNFSFNYFELNFSYRSLVLSLKKEKRVFKIEKNPVKCAFFNTE